MINVKKAWEIVKNNNPGMKVSICNETKQYYVFSLIPNNLTRGDGYGCSGVHIVDKSTGEYKTAHFTYVIHEPILNEFDTSLFE